MGNSRTQVKKAHKSCFTSKSSCQVHKTSHTDKSRISKPRSHWNAVRGARAIRIKQSKMLLFGLSSFADVPSLKRDLWGLLSGGEMILEAPHCDLLACMEWQSLCGFLRSNTFQLLIGGTNAPILCLMRLIWKLMVTIQENALCFDLVMGMHMASLSTNLRVHVSGTGDFQLGQTDILNDPYCLSERKSSNSMDTEDLHGFEVLQTLCPDALTRKPLIVENTLDPLAGEKTWPTETDTAEADAAIRERKLVRKKNSSQHLRGSDYQMIITYYHDDDQFAKEQIKAEIKKIKEANADDEEFPDEVETPVDIPAKKRFAKYRGLKWFRTSSWDPKESLPPEYARIFAFGNFAKTQKHVLSERIDSERIDRNGRNMNEVARAILFVRVHVKQVLVDIASKCVLHQMHHLCLCGASAA